MLIARAIAWLWPAFALAACGGGGSATAPSPASGATTFYVAIDGNDGWSGTTAAAMGNDGPFRSIARAQAAVRAAIGGGMRENVTVFIRAGDHYLDDEIRFRAEDSGRDGFQVVYRNYPGERPLVHRARRLTGWQPDSGQIYKARVDWSFDMLFENGVRATKARHPNAPAGGRFAYSRTSATVAGAETKRFGFTAADIPIVAQPSALEIVLWPGGPDGEFSWNQQIFVGNTVDHAAGIVTLGQEAGRTATAAVLPIGANSRYFVQGARELLDQPVMIQDVDQLGVADQNLFWHASGVYAVGYGYGDSKTTFDSARDLLDQWRANYGRRFDQNSVTVDPGFVDPTRRDFRLRPDSPAYALGYEDIDHGRRRARRRVSVFRCRRGPRPPLRHDRGLWTECDDRIGERNS